MSLVTLQGLPVLGLRLTRPVMGAWAATVEADYQNSEELFEGVLELKDSKITYRGTSLSAGIVGGVARLDLVGGTGGTIKNAPVQHFHDVTVRTLVDALLRGVGETLDSTSTRAVLQQRLRAWSFVDERASIALSTLADRLGCTWRVLPNGNVWFGLDTFPAVDEDLAKTLLELDRDDAAGNVLLAPESLELGPGVTLAGRHVGRVEHTFDRKESLRTTFWTEP
jgi:hypothetical protein